MKTHYRAVFISDLHLGSRGCQAELLSRFLKRIKCDRLYLVGDIIDGWRLKSKWYWPVEHNEVLRRILKHAKKSRVIFLPGNHDEFARQFLGHEFGGVEVRPHAVHITADEKKLLVVHGDQFDLVVSHHPFLSSLGGLAYGWLIELNRHVNNVRRLFGRPNYSLSKKIKGRVKQACTFISRFEETLLKEARRRGLDGVVCGHIHQAEYREEEGGLYLNCGDWVESCTALVEHADGRIELIDAQAFLADEEAERLLDELEALENPIDEQDPLAALPALNGPEVAAGIGGDWRADEPSAADELDQSATRKPEKVWAAP